MKTTNKNFQSYLSNVERSIRSLPEKYWKLLAKQAGFPNAKRSDLHAVALKCATALCEYEEQQKVNNGKA